MQALLGGSIQAADSDGIGPINAIQRGGDAVIVAGLINKSFFKFVAQKEITAPAQLRNKRIGVANFGGSNEFAVLLALKEWNIPKEAVTLVAAGGSAVRLAALEKKGFRRHCLALRSRARRVTDGDESFGRYSGASARISGQGDHYAPLLPGTGAGLGKKISPGPHRSELSSQQQPGNQREHPAQAFGPKYNKVIEENLNIYTGIFSLPARVGRAGLNGVLEQMQQQSGGAKGDFEIKRYLDESVIDELEREGFFKNFRSSS
jgi:hypothetical protein